MMALNLGLFKLQVGRMPATCPHMRGHHDGNFINAAGKIAWIPLV